MKYNTEKQLLDAGVKIGDLLKVGQGEYIHYEKVIQLTPEIITSCMVQDGEDGGTQGIANNAITYEILSDSFITNLLDNSIPKEIAFKIANRFYGSDYSLQRSQFNNAAKDLGY